MQITSDITIPESEIDEQFFRSSGPGGQNVNKVETAVRVRINLRTSQSLPDDARQMLIQQLESKMDSEGWVSVSSSRFRSQWQNRVEARRLLGVRLRNALRPKKPRTKTKPTRASRERRIESKKRRGEKKRNRRPPEF